MVFERQGTNEEECRIQELGVRKVVPLCESQKSKVLNPPKGLKIRLEIQACLSLKINTYYSRFAHLGNHQEIKKIESSEDKGLSD